MANRKGSRIEMEAKRSAGRNSRAKDDLMEEVKKIMKQILPDEEMAQFDQMVEFIKANRIVFKTNKTSRRVGTDFLDEAERDIRSCRALYSRRIYSHAVYHLQQAVEKAMKGYCIGLGMLSLKDIKSHDTPYLLLTGLFEKTGMRKLLESSSQETKERFGRAEEAIKKPKKRLGIARMPFEQIMFNLMLIDGYGIIAEQMDSALTKMAANFKVKSGSPPPDFTDIFIMVRLYVLGTVTFPHEEFTRYPGGQMEPKEYVPELGVVKAVGDIVGYLDPTVKDLRRILLEKH